MTLTQTVERSLPRWYLIQCKPREDERALEHLERQGFQCYRPTRSVERLRQGRRQNVVESLFPGYLFIHLDRLSDNWRPICSTRGVHGIVRFAQEPSPVPDEIVAGIRARLEGASRAPQPSLLPGERVCITDGPFADLEAIFVSVDGQERVTLMLHILQRDQAVSFPLGSVRSLK